MKTILILGGCGYIGSALYHTYNTDYIIDSVDLEWFGNYNNPNNNIKTDFCNLNKEFIQSYDVVILVAANSSVPLCRDVFDSFDNNVVKFVDLVKKLKTTQKFIYASSSCVYVTSNDKPKIEDDLLVPLDGLTLTKTTIDHLMALTDIEYYGLRLGSVNGWSPNMRLDLMINAMTTSSINNNEVNVFNGQAHRPILSVNDLCRAIEKIIECDTDHRGVYNLASVNHNISDIGKQVADYMEVPLVDKGKNFTYDFTISSEKFMNTFDFKFEDTVDSIVETILVNPTNPNWKKRESKA